MVGLSNNKFKRGVVVLASYADIVYFSGTRLYIIGCDFDGFLKGVGLTLFHHYQDVNTVLKLVSLGDIALLRKNLEPSTAGHSFDKPERDVTVAYARDKLNKRANTPYKIAELSTVGLVVQEVLKESNREHIYIYIKNQRTWYYVNGKSGEYKLLSNALELSEPKTSRVKFKRLTLTREDSVKIARYLRKNQDKAYVISKNNISNSFGDFVDKRETSQLLDFHMFSWEWFGLALGKKPKQSELAEYIYQTVNGKVK